MLLLKAIIRKTKKVTDVMWEMFDHFPNIVTKAKGQLGDLLDTVNHFMSYGKEEFAQREGFQDQSPRQVCRVQIGRVLLECHRDVHDAQSYP